MNKIAKSNSRKLILAFMFSSVIVVVILLMLKHNNHRFNGEEYIYDSVDSQCNYSENTVLYLDDSGILHLIETASGKDMVYCDRTNCTHEGVSHNNENPSCPAAFSGLSMSGTVLYKKHLYFIGNMSDEDLFKTQYLYEIDPNGEKRKKVAALEGIQSVKYVLYRDNYVIGAYCNRCEINDDGQIINDNKPEAGIFVINLDNYKVYMGDKITGSRQILQGFIMKKGLYIIQVYVSVMMLQNSW